MNKEIVVIGDIHSCIDELRELLDKIRYDPATMRLVFTGDLVDRGPDAMACFRLVKELCSNGAECVLANHEDRHRMFWLRERRKEQTSERNNMRPFSTNDMAFHKQLNEEDINWIASLPISIHLRDNFYCVHGGLESQFDFNHQRPDKVIRCRYVDKHIGKSLSMGPSYTIPEGGVFWAEEWRGPENCVFGHTYFKEPYVNVNRFGVKCVGIDQGCVYGGKLTAYMLDRDEFVSVQAKRVYYGKGIIED